MRRALILSSFFVLSPVILALSLLMLSRPFSGGFANSAPAKVAYAALPEASGTLKASIVSKDARITVIQEFLRKYKSVLEPYSEEIVIAADKYGLDYRLIPAIAMQESTLCKKSPKNSYNCWGFGIYGKKMTRFDNYSQAIEIVSKTLAKQYKAKGLDTPEKIMTKYTPSSNGSWANGVSIVMAQLSI